MINYSKGNKWTTLPDVRFIWRNPVKKSISRIVHVAFTIVSVIERLDCARFWRQISRWICKDNLSSSSRQLMYSSNGAIILNDPLTLKNMNKFFRRLVSFHGTEKMPRFHFPHSVRHVRHNVIYSNKKTAFHRSGEPKKL